MINAAPCLFRQGVFYNIKVIGIDHRSLSEGILALEISGIVGMDMSVKEEFGLIFFHQCAKDLKAAMRKVV